MNTKFCLKCNKEFIKRDTCSRKEWKTSKYCSHSCANSVNAINNGKQFLKGIIPWNKGQKLPQYTGVNNTRYTSVEVVCEECGKKFIVKNYRKNETKFCSRKCHYINVDEGKTPENERIRHSTEYKKWRELVFERDDWTCQKCLERGSFLHAHHVEGFSENKDKRFDIDNGITFCKKCHYKFHSGYGFRKNTQEQIKYFKEFRYIEE